MGSLSSFIGKVPAPLLKDAGFQRRGGEFRKDFPNGVRLYVAISSYSLGRSEIEFTCTVGISVDIFEEFMERFPRRSSSFIPWPMMDAQLYVPGGEGVWLLSLEDGAGIAGFEDCLRSVVAELEAHATPERLLEAVRQRKRVGPTMLHARPALVEALMLLKLGEVDGARLLLPTVRREAIVEWVPERLSEWVEQWPRGQR